LRLKNKRVIITGGGSGIGRETALLFSREGARVVVADCESEGGKETVHDISNGGREALFIDVDISSSDQVDHMVDKTIKTFGGIDILFNNAGILYFGTILDTKEETWNKILSINLTGTFLCSKAVIPHMIESGGGSIINMSSSTGAHDAAGNAVAYITSKGGVTLLTKAMAIDHAKDNIRVNAIAPGPTYTQMLRNNMSEKDLEAFKSTFPMKRFGKPEEIAYTALFLASDEASFVTGAIITVDGGQTAEV
jgi:meso-butanediol dehydrogenase/(S,S)-butanediol dehydrogenase/diacetyl reductase